MSKCLRLTDKYNQVISLPGVRPFFDVVRSVRIMNGKMFGRIREDGKDIQLQYIANNCWEKRVTS